MIRRVRRPKERSQLLEELTDRENGVFETYKDAMVFAAAFGAWRKTSQSFDKVDEPIDISVFERNAEQFALIDMLGLYKTGEAQILSEDRADERLRIFEEYANAGLELIEQELRSSNRPPIDVLVRLTHEPVRHAKSGDDVGLEHLVEELGGFGGSGNRTTEGRTGG